MPCLRARSGDGIYAVGGSSQDHPRRRHLYSRSRRRLIQQQSNHHRSRFPTESLVAWHGQHARYAQLLEGGWVRTRAMFLDVGSRYCDTLREEMAGRRWPRRRGKRRSSSAIVDGWLDQGPDLSFLSAFPHEKEFTYPPLTFFRPVGKMERLIYNGTEFTILEGKAFLLHPTRRTYI